MNIVNEVNNTESLQHTAMPHLPVDGDDEQAKVNKISAVVLSMQQRWQPWRDQAIKCYEYVIGNQISPAVRAKLAKQNRPALVFNLMLPLQVYIAGTLATNKTAMKAVPKRSGDEAGVEMANVLVSDWWMANCDGYDEIAKAGIDATICGLGYINNWFDMSEDIEGMGVTEAADPLTIMVDPDAPIHKPKKWRYYTVSGYYSAEEIIAMHSSSLKPERKALIKERAKLLEGNYQELGKPQGWLKRVYNGTLDLFGVSKSNSDSNPYKTDFIDAANGLYRVIEFHDKRIVTKRIFYDPITRETIELKSDAMDEAEVAQLKAQYPSGQVVESEKTEYWKTVAAPGLLPDKLIFEQPYEEKVQGKGWQHTVVVCYDFHWDATKVIGLQGPLIDPVDSYNQRRMTMLELLMDMVNPATEAEENSISADNMEAWTTKDRGVIRFFKRNFTKPERATPPIQALAGLSNFAEEDRDLVPKIIGVSPNLQGFKESSNEPASLYTARVNQGMVMLNYFFSHLNKATRTTFNFNYGLIQEYVNTPRAVRILGEPEEGTDLPGMIKSDKEVGAYWLQLNWPTLNGVLNDVREGQYDFTADTTQLGQTQKAMKFYEAMEFVKTVPPEFVQWAEMFQLWDSPVAKKMGAFASAIMKMKTDQLTMQAQVAQSGAAAAVTENKLKQTAGAISAEQIAAQAGSRIGQ